MTLRASLSVLWLCATAIGADVRFVNGQKYNLVFEGDSLTLLFSNQPYYPTYFTNIAEVRPFIGIFTNAGQNGDYVVNMASTYTSQIHPYAPVTPTNGVFFIWGGINDVNNPSYATNDIYAALTNEWWNARQDGFKVIAFTITDRSEFHTYPDRLARRDAMNGYIVAASNLWDSLYRADQKFPDCNDTTYYTNDLVHLNTNSLHTIAVELSQMLLPVASTTRVMKALTARASSIRPP